MAVLDSHGGPELLMRFLPSFLVPLGLAAGACGGESTRELPLENVSIALYTQPLVVGDDGTATITFPREDTQHIEVALPPDLGVYVFLVAGKMTLTVPASPEVGSLMTVHGLDLEVTRDDFLPHHWLLGAKLRLRDSIAECVERTDTGSRWAWQTVGDLRITTHDGRGRETLAWVPDDHTGSLQETDTGPTLFAPALAFARGAVTP